MENLSTATVKFICYIKRILKFEKAIDFCEFRKFVIQIFKIMSKAILKLKFSGFLWNFLIEIVCKTCVVNNDSLYIKIKLDFPEKRQ